MCVCVYMSAMNAFGILSRVAHCGLDSLSGSVACKKLWASHAKLDLQKRKSWAPALWDFHWLCVCVVSSFLQKNKNKTGAGTL